MATLRILILITLGLSLDSSHVKAIDGGYSDWSECSECSVTCGGGSKTLTRTCTNPPPSDGGKNCSEQGLPYEIVSCNDQGCPVDGGYTDWSISKCSVTCGGGAQTLTRTCTNPPPSNGGKDCSDLGPVTKTVSCIQPNCPINGKYSDWVECPNCSVPCGGGIKVLTRSCNNPPPSYGGKNCIGPAVKNASCNPHDCPPPCKPALDIVLILDKSSSIRKKHLEKAVAFLGKLVGEFNPAPDADHFGFITFSRNAHLVFSFAESKYHDKDKLLDKIASEQIITQRGTGTHLAFGEAAKVFTVAGGDRPDVPNILILLTDGRPDNVMKTVEAAKVLKKKDVYIVAVGIGKGIDKDTLRQIVGVSNPVVIVKDFNQLEKVIDKIKSKTCSD